MKNTLKVVLFILTILTVISCQKDNGIENKEAEIQAIKEAICATSFNETPIEILGFTDEVGEIVSRERRGSDSTFFIVVNNYPQILYACKFPLEFKKGGLKVKISGNVYRVKCTGNGPCGSTEGDPFLIKSIKPL